MGFYTTTSSSSAVYSDMVAGVVSTTPVNVTGYVEMYSGTPEFYPITIGAPVVSSVSPSAGVLAGGNTVTINGFGFTTANAVSFNGTAATSFTLVNDNQITAVVPAGAASTVDVVVTNSNGASATSAGDTYTYTNHPVVTAVAPLGGPINTTTAVTITGVGFTGATAVNFGGIAATGVIVNGGGTQITATAPAEAAGVVDVTVTTPALGTSVTSSSDKFTYAALPTLSSIAPTLAWDGGGSIVTLNGANFISGGTTVTFGGTPATSVTFVSGTQITAVAPAGTDGAVDVAVTTVGGSATLASALTYAHTIAAAETLATGAVTLNDNPVITAILSQPGTYDGKTYAAGAYAFLIQDATGSAEIYSTSAAPLPGGYVPVVGNTISVSGTWSPFHQIPELGTITAISTTGTAAVPAPQNDTIPQVNLTTLPNGVAGYLVTLKGVNISSTFSPAATTFGGEPDGNNYRSFR